MKVREVARIAGVSALALHHNDAVGPLVPSHRTRAGCRLFNADDLPRLQQILVGRELVLSLPVRNACWRVCAASLRTPGCPFVQGCCGHYGWQRKLSGEAHDVR